MLNSFRTTVRVTKQSLWRFAEFMSLRETQVIVILFIKRTK